MALAVGCIARLALDNAPVRVAEITGLLVLVVLPGGRREYIERRHLLLPINGHAAAEERAYTESEGQARARAASNAHVLASEAERQACARAAASTASTALPAGFAPGIFLGKGLGVHACASAPAQTGASAPAQMGAIDVGRRWVQGVFPRKSSTSARSPAPTAAPPAEPGAGSAMAAENARLRWLLGEAQAQLAAAAAPPDAWADRQEARGKELGELAARNRVLEGLVAAAEAQLRTAGAGAAAEVLRLERALRVADHRARGYQAVAAALEQQVVQLRQQLADLKQQLAERRERRRQQRQPDARAEEPEGDLEVDENKESTPAGP
jgi:hypothetical protein